MSAESGEVPEILQTDIKSLEQEGYEISVERKGQNVYAVIESYPLPDTFSPSHTKLLVIVPLPYPETEIDMFWTEPEARGPNGIPEQADVTATHIGQEWRRFSWHRNGEWNPAYHDLIDHVEFIKSRFSESDKYD